ncbi:unnamed protein product [Rhizophagus irregularis]|nr:unnamed protein product [Rhizophagus irregularis]CAB5351593.1 unnamed protein product [Rhizophagus irregularis]
MWGDSYNDDNEFNTLEYNDSSQLSQVNLNSKLSSSSKISSLSASKLYQFENLPEPRNATEAFHSKSYVPAVDNMKEFDNDPIENQDDSESKSIDSVNEPYNHISKSNVVEDENEIYNNTDFHSEEQNNMEIPEDKKVLESENVIEEQEAFHSKPHVPVDNIKEFDNDPIENQDDSESKSIDNINEPYNHIIKLNVIEDENEIYNNTDFHSEEQNNMEISEDKKVPEPRNVTEEQEVIHSKPYNFSTPVDNNINNELILKSNIIEDEDKNFLEERNDIEQHNNLEISEDILLNSLIVENLTKSNTIEDKQDNLETPKVIDNFNKSENLMKPIIIKEKEIDKSNNQFEIIEYNENTKPNLENQDCLNIYKDEVKQKSRNLKNLKKRFSIINYIKKLPKLLKKKGKL